MYVFINFTLYLFCIFDFDVLGSSFEILFQKYYNLISS